MHMHCPYCDTTVLNADEGGYIESRCESCGEDWFVDPDNCGEEDNQREDGYKVGDIVEDIFGFHILTPFGWWDITTEDALSLNAGISAMLQLQLTRPWDNNDQSTIITRGRRINLEGISHD